MLFQNFFFLVDKSIRGALTDVTWSNLRSGVWGIRHFPMNYTCSRSGEVFQLLHVSGGCKWLSQQGNSSVSNSTDKNNQLKTGKMRALYIVYPVLVMLPIDERMIKEKDGLYNQTKHIQSKRNCKKLFVEQWENVIYSVYYKIFRKSY